MFYSIFWAIGSLAGSIAIYVSERADPLNWRGPLWAQLVMLGLFLPGLILSPESPWFHLRKGDEVKAKRAMQSLYGSVPSYDVDYEYAQISLTLAKEKQAEHGVSSKDWLECFRGTNL